MDDNELWPLVVAQARQEYAALPAGVRARIGALAAEMAELKERHQQLVAAAGAGAVCAACQGACCRFGRHHFSVVDLLAFLDSGTELFEPDFASPVCPCHDGSGCLMPPALRPFTCIIFICEELDDRLSAESRCELLAIENRLRAINASFENLLGNRFGSGLLLTGRRSAETGRPLFAAGPLE